MTDVLTLEAVKAKGGRRFLETEITGLGIARIRSLKTSEYSRVEAITTRAMVSLNGKKKNEGQRLLKEAKYELIKLCWVDGEGRQIAPSTADLDEIDYAFIGAFEEACLEHCGANGVSVDDAGKN